VRKATLTSAPAARLTGEMHDRDELARSSLVTSTSVEDLHVELPALHGLADPIGVEAGGDPERDAPRSR